MKGQYAVSDPLRRIKLERRVLAVIVRALGRGPSTSRDRVVLIAAPGGGNIGDQAMLDACIVGAQAPVDVIVRDAGTLRLPPVARERVLPNLLYGGTVMAMVEAVRFARLVARARSVIVAGADIMDGAYSDTASSRRFLLVEAASLVTDARVVGFSWNDHPAPRALATLRTLSHRVRLYVRDAVSLARIAPLTEAEVTPVADVVFSLERDSEESMASQWMVSQRGLGRRVIAVNVNAVIEGRVPHFEAVCRELTRMIQEGWSVVAVPHDARNAPSDMSLAGRLVAALPEGTAYEAPLLGPAGILGITEEADLVLTGRMHLAILGFTRGTPTVTIAYQGKVAGLYRRIGFPENMIEPDEQIAESLHAVLTRVVDELPASRVRILEALPALRRDGLLNFAGLGASAPAPLLTA